MSAGEKIELSDDAVTSFISDPATIPTHEIALEILLVLENEIASIQAQVDAAVIESNIRPLSEERMAWLHRATYAGVMRRNERHRVIQRDKEIRSIKNGSGTPRNDPDKREANRLKQERLMAEAETRRIAKKLAMQEAANKTAKIAQQRRELAALRSHQCRFYESAKRILPEATFEAIKAELTKDSDR